MEDNDELLRDLLDVFKREFPVLLASLQNAIANRDMAQVERLGHNIKGMTSTLAFGRAAEAARQIERMGKEQILDGPPEELVKLEHEANLAVAELEAYCKRSPRRRF